jgi:DNA-binding IclR family transcriptional regulator
MPRGPRKILLGVFDAQPIFVLESIAITPRSFTEVLNATGLPKATVHRVLTYLMRNKLAKKAGDRYEITSDGKFVLESFKSLTIRSMLKITDDGLRRVLNQVGRTLRMERSGFSRLEQFQNIQEAVESVKVIEVPA